MSAHKAVRVDESVAAQWTTAMRRAMGDAGVAPELVKLIDEAFVRMAGAMVNT
jgi:truncated hemoglobin YjbI